MKACNKCGIVQPIDCFHTEIRRGQRKHKARCMTCVRREWADYQARQKGNATPTDKSAAFNGWHGVVTRGVLSPTLGLRP